MYFRAQNTTFQAADTRQDVLQPHLRTFVLGEANRMRELGRGQRYTWNTYIRQGKTKRTFQEQVNKVQALPRQD